MGPAVRNCSSLHVRLVFVRTCENFVRNAIKVGGASEIGDE
jgi:hypothetical protein